ncbi:PSP1 C terminal conserved region [Trypanosoma vivax]|nr:hypothetical protein TRVL_08661 [Trypanosoma vivax]KAH8608073.1 PSP1 C terminal conserved region [Trypanosoma vivax]
MSCAPLSDCTTGVIQRENMVDSSAIENAKNARIRRHTHNPYCRITLTPMTTIEAHDCVDYSEPTQCTLGFHSVGVLDGARAPVRSNNLHDAYNGKCYSTGPYAPPSSCNGQYSVPFAHGESRSREVVPVEADENRDASLGVDRDILLGNSTASRASNGPPVVSTPPKCSNNLYKMYVYGRPKVVRGITCAEVQVELRLGSELFLVEDVPSVFGHALCPEELVGRYVVVEGDRGEDLGRITTVSKEMQYSALEKQNHPRVLREATAKELESFRSLDELEEGALRFCKAAICSLNMRVPLQVERAVFQFDRKKLTFTYSSDGYVEFKALLRALNRQYQCRIWMHQLNWDMNGKERRQASEISAVAKEKADERKQLNHRRDQVTQRNNCAAHSEVSIRS